MRFDINAFDPTLFDCVNPLASPYGPHYRWRTTGSPLPSTDTSTSDNFRQSLVIPHAIRTSEESSKAVESP